MRTTRSSSRPGGVSTRHPPPRSRLRGTMHPPRSRPPRTRRPPGTRHPHCGQNHRHLWKYNLAPTSLRAVTRKQSSRMRTNHTTTRIRTECLSNGFIGYLGGCHVLCIYVQYCPLSLSHRTHNTPGIRLVLPPANEVCFHRCLSIIHSVQPVTMRPIVNR